MKGLLALSFVIVNVVSDVSVAEEALHLCSNSSNYENYTKSITHSCGCKNTNTCLRKCCQSGFYLRHYEDLSEGVFESVCVKNGSDPFNVPIHKGHEHVFNTTLEDNFLVGMLECGNEGWQYFKMNNSDKKERFYIQENGSLYYPYSRIKFYNNNRYCIDEQDGLTAFLCYTPQNSGRSIGRLINAIGMIISMPFLLLTFIVFAVVPNATVHKRSLMCYALSLFLAYAFLVTIQLHTKPFKPAACQSIGYFIILFFMSSFFWMNVLCFDTWFAFGGLAKFSRDPKSEKRRFAIYSVYAWGLPIIHVIIVYLLNNFSDVNWRYHPGIGIYRCFLEEKLPTFLYFYGPLTVIIGLNIILFLLTSIKIHKIKLESNSFHGWSTKTHSFENDKKKFNLYVKLLLAMGINWSLEIVSWAVQLREEERQEISTTTTVIFYISDFCNAIYGFIIFLIFVYRKTVWKSFKKRLLASLHATVPGCKSYEVEELGKFSANQQDFNSKTSTTSRDIVF